jgi:hypothetical protein
LRERQVEAVEADSKPGLTRQGRREVERGERRPDPWLRQVESVEPNSEPRLTRKRRREVEGRERSANTRKVEIAHVLAR